MNYRFSSSVQRIDLSAVREILKLTQGRSVISFAGGLPAEEFFPMQAVRAAYECVLRQDPAALQYGLTEGYTPLRQALAARLCRQNIHATEDRILLTTGSQQAIDLVTRVCVDSGDVILVERPTYLAALQVFHSREARVVCVEGDACGMDPEDVARKIEHHRPKLVYVNPNFSNPRGHVWSAERRQALLSLCRRSDVLILEDDPYGELRFEEGADYPSILSLDHDRESPGVVYVSTFSKTVAPALRTGWAVGAPAIIQHMTRAKQAADLHSSSLDQQALYRILRDFDLDAHIVFLRQQYARRMACMEAHLRRLQPDGLRWDTPRGGMFFWIELPDGFSAEALLAIAVQKGVAFVPGTPFYVGAPALNTLRLNFTHTGEERMGAGMERLAEALREYRQTVAA